MAKKSDKTVNAAGDAVQQEMTAENGSSEQATAKQSSKKSKKDKNATSTSENVTSNMDEDIPVPQLNEDGSIAIAEQAPASTTTADTTTEKSKKRKRKDGEATTGPEGTTSAEALPPKEKSKKSKKSKDANATDTSASAQAVDTLPQPGTVPQEVLAAVMAAPVPALEASIADDASKKKEKKKKIKKDKSGTAAEDGADNNTEMQVDTVNPVASTSSAPANASTESTHVVNSAETGQEDNGKKKRKKKDKEVADETAGGDETTDKSKKKKKKDKEASATNVSAPSAVEPSSTLNISADPAGLTTARRDRQSTSPLPELRLPPFPPPPPAASTSIPAPASTSISASALADYENIDPSLRPTSRTTAPSSITPGGGGMPIARSTSMTGSTSIQPRDPSMPPPGTATSGPILPTMPTPTAGNNGDAAPKKRGRPKKIAPDAVPASAPGSNANANSATQLVPAAPSAAPAGRGISASAVPPSGRAPGSSVSPNMPTSNLPASTASTSAIAPSSTAPAPAPAAAAAAAPSSSTSAAATTSRLSSSTNIFPGVNPNTLARAAMNPDFVPATLPEGTTPLQPSENKETHQELLASRWLNTKDMADLIEKEGLKVRTGKFSKAEDAALKLCIENYRQQQGLTQEQIDGIIFAKGRNTRADYGDFWTILTRAVPDRALMSVYHHTKRIMQTDARKGPWSAEEDAKLKSAYKQFGPSWIKVSAVVGRWENDCRDRWRAYVGPNERIQKGKWSKEEEDKLRETIRQVKIDIAKWKKENANGAPIEDEPAGGSDMFWSRVATKMGTRSRHQCRIKWNDHMRNKLLTADGKPVRWAKRDTFILVMKLHSLQLTDEDEIAWKLLPDSHWNWWSPHVLHKRWFTMKQRAKKQLENENASYSDIINWLKNEQDRIPRKEVKAFMAKKPGEVDGADEDGDGEDDDGEEEEGGAQANAGTSAAAESTTNGTAAATQRIANGPSEMRKKKAQDQSQFRTSEFVNSSDEED